MSVLCSFQYLDPLFTLEFHINSAFGLKEFVLLFAEMKIEKAFGFWILVTLSSSQLNDLTADAPVLRFHECERPYKLEKKTVFHNITFSCILIEIFIP
jgi:hypothetical protein